MCNLKRGARNERREKLSSGIVGSIPQSEREPAVPKRGARERKIPRAIFFDSFFSSFLIRDVVAKSLRAMEETRADECLPWCKTD